MCLVFAHSCECSTMIYSCKLLHHVVSGPYFIVGRENDCIWLVQLKHYNIHQIIQQQLYGEITESV